MRTAAPLALMILIALAPMLVSLSKPGPQHHMEGLALLTAQETWMRQHQGETNAWLLPTQNGQVRVRKPPMFVWLNMLAWSGLDPAAADANELIHRARLVSVALALVMMLSTFWIGRTLWSVDESAVQIVGPSHRASGNAAGFFAAMIVGTMILTQQQARIASYDMHLAAWATLSVAAALWAMNADRRVHRLAAWSIAGTALALSWMSKGPIALFLMALPVVAFIGVDPRKRLGRGLQLSGCMLLATALVIPWYAYLFFEKPDAWKTIWHEIGASLTNAQPLYYYPLDLLKLSLPWTLWVVAGLIAPFVGTPVNDRSAASRNARWVPWIWFFGLLVAFSIPAGKATRYILPIAPAMALAAASVWREHQTMKRRDAGAQWLMIAHWVILFGASVGMTLALVRPELLAKLEWVQAAILYASVFPNKIAMIALISLVLVASLGAWRHSRYKLLGAAIATAVWMSIVTTFCWDFDSRRSKRIDFYESQSRQIAAMVGSAPMGYLSNSYDDQPDYDFLLFMRRIVPPVKPRHLEGFGDGKNLAYVMAETNDANNQTMLHAGYVMEMPFEDGPGHRRELWRKSAKPQAAMSMMPEVQP